MLVIATYVILERLRSFVRWLLRARFQPTLDPGAPTTTQDDIFSGVYFCIVRLIMVNNEVVEVLCSFNCETGLKF